MEQKDAQGMSSPAVENHRILLSGNAEPLWTVVEVARYLQLEPETVRHMARRKELPGLKVGRMWRFSKEKIEDWLQEASEKSQKTE